MYIQHNQQQNEFCLNFKILKLKISKLKFKYLII